MSPASVSRVTPPQRRSGPVAGRAVAVAFTVLGLMISLLSVLAPRAHAEATLLSQGKTVTASSIENGGTPAATDGDLATRWSSAYGKAFQLQTSTSGSVWTPIYSTTTGTGGTQTLNVSGSGRYLRYVRHRDHHGAGLPHGRAGLIGPARSQFEPERSSTETR